MKHYLEPSTSKMCYKEFVPYPCPRCRWKKRVGKVAYLQIAPNKAALSCLNKECAYPALTAPGVLPIRPERRIIFRNLDSDPILATTVEIRDATPDSNLPFFDVQPQENGLGSPAQSFNSPPRIPAVTRTPSSPFSQEAPIFSPVPSMERRDANRLKSLASSEAVFLPPKTSPHVFRNRVGHCSEEESVQQSKFAPYPCPRCKWKKRVGKVAFLQIAPNKAALTCLNKKCSYPALTAPGVSPIRPEERIIDRNLDNDWIPASTAEVFSAAPDSRLPFFHEKPQENGSESAAASLNTPLHPAAVARTPSSLFPQEAVVYDPVKPIIAPSCSKESRKEASLPPETAFLPQKTSSQISWRNRKGQSSEEDTMVDVTGAFEQPEVRPEEWQGPPEVLKKPGKSENRKVVSYQPTLAPASKSESSLFLAALSELAGPSNKQNEPPPPPPEEEPNSLGTVSDRMDTSFVSEEPESDAPIYTELVPMHRSEPEPENPVPVPQENLDVDQFALPEDEERRSLIPTQPAGLFFEKKKTDPISTVKKQTLLKQDIANRIKKSLKGEHIVDRFKMLAERAVARRSAETSSVKKQQKGKRSREPAAEPVSDPQTSASQEQPSEQVESAPEKIPVRNKMLGKLFTSTVNSQKPSALRPSEPSRPSPVPAALERRRAITASKLVSNPRGFNRFAGYSQRTETVVQVDTAGPSPASSTGSAHHSPVVPDDPKAKQEMVRRELERQKHEQFLNLQRQTLETSQETPVTEFQAYSSTHFQGERSQPDAFHYDYYAAQSVPFEEPYDILRGDGGHKQLVYPQEAWNGDDMDYLNFIAPESTIDELFE